MLLKQFLYEGEVLLSYTFNRNYSCEILIPVEEQHEVLSEIIIPVKDFHELVNIISGIKQVGGVYVVGMSKETPNRLCRVEIIINPRLNEIRGLVMLDDEALDQFGEVLK